MIRLTSLAIALSSALLSVAALAQTAPPTTDPTPRGHHGLSGHALKKLDTDGDGRVSLNEYLAGASARFKAADVNNTGTLSAAQLASSPQAQRHNQRTADRLVKRLDTAQKGYVTADDFVAEAQKRFARLDPQGSGKVTLEQFSAAPAARFGRAAFASTTGTDAGAATGKRAAFRQQFAQAEFAKLDTNGDGVVTQAEFTAAAKGRFAAMDTQNNGKLTAQQIATSPVAQQRDLKFAQHVVKKLDTNGDGVVSLDEYLAGAKARFSRLDNSGDGYLDTNDGGGRRGPHGKDAQPTS
jgi:Ca2+-binding EF-hand superfamily protein